MSIKKKKFLVHLMILNDDHQNKFHSKHSNYAKKNDVHV